MHERAIGAHTETRLQKLKRRALPVVVGVASGLLLGIFVSKIGDLGHRIPSDHLFADYFVALLWCLGIALFILSLPSERQERQDLVLLWGVRCAVTLLAMMFYEANYPLDAYHYYSISTLSEFGWEGAGYGRGTENTQGLSWLMVHYLPMAQSYHALKVVFSFLGYVACYVVYRAFAPFFPERARALRFLIFLFPSMIFWSSILGKDPVILLGISIYIYGVVRFIYRGNASFIPLIAIGIALAATFRSWYLPILVIPLASLGIRGIKRPLFKYAFLALILGGAAYSAQMFADQFQVSNVEELVGRTQTVSRSWAKGGSANTAPVFSGITGMLKFAPIGMFTALFRPLPGEVMNPFGLLAGFENLFMLGFIVHTIRVLRRDRAKLREPMTTWGITLILVWSFIYGFVSFQNLGSGVRFRLQILPMMLCLLFFLSSPSRGEGSEDGGAADVRNRGLS